MAVDNKQIATEVLEHVGGPSNVQVATNCMTRLRLTLIDNEKVDLEAVKKVKGVLGAQFSGAQFQVIIGQNVPKVLDEFVAMSGVARGEVVDENLDAPTERFELKNLPSIALDYLSGSMTQLIPIIMAGGLFRTLAVVIGPQLLNIVAEESATYQFFYTTLFEGSFYFLPIYLGYAAAKKLGASQGLGMLLGAILIAPSVVAAAGVGEWISVYGIPIAAADYSQSVLPMMLSMPILYFVERSIKKVMPDVLSTIFTPFLTMVVVVPIAFIIMGPIGNLAGGAIGNALFGLADLGGVAILVVMAIIGAVWQLLVVGGMHMPIIMLAIVQITEVGYDPFVFVSTNCAMFAVWGCAIGAFLKIREKDEKALCAGYIVAALAGGVTEPALFGCVMRWRRVMLGMLAGGAAGAVVSGLLGVTYYMAGGGTNLLIFLNYLQGGTQNVTYAVIGCVVSVVVAAVVTYLFGFSEEELKELRPAA